MLSIYNLLECVRLESVDSYAFRRYMQTPTSKIYVEECKSQKAQSSGDFICQIKAMLDGMAAPTSLSSISLAQDLFGVGNSTGQPQAKQTWALFDIGYSGAGNLTYELWHRKLQTGFKGL